MSRRVQVPPHPLRDRAKGACWLHTPELMVQVHLSAIVLVHPSYTKQKRRILGGCAELVSQLTVNQPLMHCRFESYSTHFCNRPIMVLELPAKESVVSSAYRFNPCRLRLAAMPQWYWARLEIW